MAQRLDKAAQPAAPPSSPASAAATTPATLTNPGSPGTNLPQGPSYLATDRLIIVALDAGQGGEDPGAIGPGGTQEKDVVPKLACLLRDCINAAPMRAFLTRDADYFVPCTFGCKRRAGYGPI